MKKMMNSAVFAATVMVLMNSGSAFAREILCSLPSSAKTVDGIRVLGLRVSDQGGPSTASIVRDGQTVAEEVPTNLGRVDTQPESEFFLTNSVFLSKTRDVEGSFFSLVKTKETLSGPNCDGYHSCTVTTTILESAPITCEDSFDLIRSDGGYDCKADPMSDCI